MELTRAEGLFGCIVQSKFIKTAYGEALRKLLSSKSQPKVIIDLADAPAFPDTTTYPLILIAASEQPVIEDVLCIDFASRVSEQQLTEAFVKEFPDDNSEVYNRVIVKSDRFQISSQWSLMSPALKDLDRHFSPDLCYPFGTICLSISKGIVTCLRDAYLQNQNFFSRHGIEQELISPIVTGADLSRYDLDPTANYALFPYKKCGFGCEDLVDITKFPRANQYFSHMRNTLEERRFFGKTIKEAGLKFYEIPHVSSYSRDPKIIFAKIAKVSSFSYDLVGNTLCYETCFFATVKDTKEIPFLTTLLNSTLLFHILRQKTTILAGGFLEYKGRYVEALPIRRINFTTPPQERTNYLEKAKISTHTAWTKTTRSAFSASSIITSPRSQKSQT